MKKMTFGRFDYADFAVMFAYAASSLVIPVVLVEAAGELHFALDAGGMSRGGALQVGRSLSMVAAMLFCGFLAARFGLRKMLGAGALLMALGITFAALSRWYWMLFAVLVAAGVGEGLVEGLATPVVQALHRDDEPGCYINFTHGFWSIGIFVCVPVIGLLLARGFSWRIPVAGVGALALAAALLLLWPPGRVIPAVEGESHADFRGFLRRTGAILRRRRFWLFFAAMFFAGGGEFCLTFWCATLLRLEFHATALTGGLGTALFSAGMLLGRTGSGMLIDQRHFPHLVVAAGAIGAVLTAIFPWVFQLRWIMILLFFAGLTSAPFWPSIQSYCADRLAELDSTLIFVLLSCAGVPGCGIITAVVGWFGDRWGLRQAFYAVSVCYLAMAGLIAYDMRRGGKNRGGRTK